jgi:hypothetical protein
VDAAAVEGPVVNAGFRIQVGLLHLEAKSEPLELPRALGALARQPALAAPAKLVLLQRGEASLMAEIPRAVPRAAGEELVLSALEEGRRWLENGAAAENVAGRSGGGGGGNGMQPESVEQVLGELPWSWMPDESGAYRVDAKGSDGTFRLRITGSPAGGLRLSSSATLRAGAPEVKHALPLFALESNRRIRLARLGIAWSGDERARALWEAVLPAALPPERTLRGALEAVVGARSATARALAALCDARVAGAYLRLRGEWELPSPVAAAL